MFIKLVCKSIFLLLYHQVILLRFRDIFLKIIFSNFFNFPMTYSHSKTQKHVTCYSTSLIHEVKLEFLVRRKSKLWPLVTSYAFVPWNPRESVGSGQRWPSCSLILNTRALIGLHSFRVGGQQGPAYGPVFAVLFVLKISHCMTIPIVLKLINRSIRVRPLSNHKFKI